MKDPHLGDNMWLLPLTGHLQEKQDVGMLNSDALPHAFPTSTNLFKCHHIAFRQSSREEQMKDKPQFWQGLKRGTLLWLLGSLGLWVSLVCFFTIVVKKTNFSSMPLFFTLWSSLLFLLAKSCQCFILQYVHWKKNKHLLLQVLSQRKSLNREKMLMLA